MLQVIWAPEAEETFDAIHTHILNNWGAQSSANFIRKTKKLLKSISVMPHMFPQTKIPNIRKAVIVPKSSLFYEVHEDHIGLLFFWDNRQEPISL
jgi:plasmid stabilization system protein ParE